MKEERGSGGQGHTPEIPRGCCREVCTVSDLSDILSPPHSWTPPLHGSQVPSTVLGAGHADCSPGAPGRGGWPHGAIWAVMPIETECWGATQGDGQSLAPTGALLAEREQLILSDLNAIKTLEFMTMRGTRLVWSILCLFSATHVLQVSTITRVVREILIWKACSVLGAVTGSGDTNSHSASRSLKVQGIGARGGGVQAAS